MYPNNYRNGSTCEWEVSVPRGFQVALVFDFFDLGTSDICPTDYLVVKELNKDDGREETYCPGVNQRFLKLQYPIMVNKKYNRNSSFVFSKFLRPSEPLPI